ncbi:hypothetical protein WA026_021339 [Henosepilachna vigintioctopunctata]|uniref:Uncharacterized protein n=1 Tax=Henosepilachna vigintioctopunctata TaxID=420089 RepID=A0AAW1UGC2_9CUCU
MDVAFEKAEGILHSIYGDVEFGETHYEIEGFTFNTVFPITNANLKKGKFGTAILLELNDQFVYLPQRSTEVLKDKLNYLKDQIYGLKVTGLKEYANLSPSVLFEIVEL